VQVKVNISINIYEKPYNWIVTEIRKVFYIAILFLGIQNSAYANIDRLYDWWDQYRTIQISRTESDGSLSYISSKPEEIYQELDEKKAELLLFINRISELEDCKLNQCFKLVVVDNVESQIPISQIEIQESIDSLSLKAKTLGSFISYVEDKIVKVLENLVVRIDANIDGRQFMLEDLRSNIVELVNENKITPINTSQDVIKIILPESWEGKREFAFSGTVTEVLNSLKNVENQVSEQYEKVTGIKVLFNDIGGVNWDLSSARTDPGIGENTSKEEYDAYVALKELTIAKGNAANQVIEKALLKPISERSDYEKSLITQKVQSNLDLLKVFNKQLLSNTLSLGFLYEYESNKLAPEKESLISKRNEIMNCNCFSEEDKQVNLDLLQERLNYIESYLNNISPEAISEQNQRNEIPAIDNLIDEIRTLNPETSEQDIDRALEESEQSALVEVDKYKEYIQNNM